MSNFGFLNLRVVNPYEVAFREARSAVGAGKVLAQAVEYKGLAEAIADCALVVGTTTGERRDVLHPLRNLEDAAPVLQAELKRNGVALLFGSEKLGLTNEDLNHCHWLLRIPTREEHSSMNLGQAVAVCAYELARSHTLSRCLEATPAPASAGKLEVVTSALMESLRASGYVGSNSEGAIEGKVRRLIRRFHPSEEDADICLGMLRQIAWKLRQLSNQR